MTPTEGGWRLDGEKFYSTGALYADWIDVFARRSDTASDVIAGQHPADRRGAGR